MDIKIHKTSYGQITCGIEGRPIIHFTFIGKEENAQLQRFILYSLAANLLFMFPEFCTFVSSLRDGRIVIDTTCPDEKSLNDVVKFMKRWRPCSCYESIK